MSPSNRRKLLIGAAAAAGAAGLAGGLWWRHGDDRMRGEEPARAPLPVRDPAFPNALRVPGARGMYGVIDITGPLAIVAKTVHHEILPGKPVAMLGFEVEHEGNRYVNPVLRVASGAGVRADFWNALEETSIIHWHGLKVDANNDGHPHYAIPASSTYQYNYRVPNRASTYWYHPHAHGRTAAQIHQGLAGLYIVEDAEELALRKALDFELGVTDVPLVLQDKRLDETGAPYYGPEGSEWMHGYLGNGVLVNLTDRPHLDVTARVHRFRVLNASMARIYRLAFESGGRMLDFALLGGDGGLLPAARPAREAFLSPGERVDIALDFSRVGPGASVTLKSLAFDPMCGPAPAPGVGTGPDCVTPPGGRAGSRPPQAPPLADGSPIELMKLYVLAARAPVRAIPAALSPGGIPGHSGASVRRVAIDHHRMAWRINGRLFDMRGIGLTVKSGSREIWEISNPADGMPHPMHMHGFQFRVLERAGSPEQVRRLALAERGLTATDLGWKDTVLVWPGETVRIGIEFTHHYVGDQVYMFHCHNLQHADRGMMVNVRIAA
ncbi:MAG: multicopper oxidase domain-containing protein [Burkholderiales bacterium]|nr:multicopper oxidase domain-containing protein [Burkholderiales bacterium]